MSINIDGSDLYNVALPQWELVEDAVSGQAAVKAKTTTYLPIPDPETLTENGEQNRINLLTDRYRQYILRAVYYNVCFRTLQGLVGVVFRKSPMVNLAGSIDYIEANADGSGLTLNQQAQWTLAEVIKKGRALLLVDYPAVSTSTSRADVNRGIRATIKNYTAESVLDWNEETTEIGMQLNFVKLIEVKNILNIETGERETEAEYIILRLIDGVYTMTRYNEDGEMIGEVMTPTLGNGQPLNFIPALFVGSENNNPDIDQALLYDLAELNIAHYRNSADYEEACFITGQPTLAITSSLSADDWKEYNPNGVLLGSRKGHFLGESGSMALVQANPNTMPAEAMLNKEAQFLTLGAQLVSPNGNETAFTTGVNLATNTSSLALVVGNVSDAYLKCLGWCSMFMERSGVEATDLQYSLNTDFFPSHFDAATISAWVAGVQSRVLPKSALYEIMREANLTEKTDEEIIAEIEESNADGLDLSAE